MSWAASRAVRELRAAGCEAQLARLASAHCRSPHPAFLTMHTFDVVIVGAGPAGLATAIAAIQHGLDHFVIEKGALVNSLLHYPVEMVFFTTPELMEIGGMPFTSPNDKPTRLEALRYYRRVTDVFKLKIAFDERVVAITREAPATPALVRRRQPVGARRAALGARTIGGHRHRRVRCREPDGRARARTSHTSRTTTRSRIRSSASAS